MIGEPASWRLFDEALDTLQHEDWHEDFQTDTRIAPGGGLSQRRLFPGPLLRRTRTPLLTHRRGRPPPGCPGHRPVPPNGSENTSEPGTFDVTVQVTAAIFDGFAAKVESMELQKGIENSLTSKIDAAKKSFEKGKTKTLINQLEAFENEVNAIKGKKITENQANELLECADFLIGDLSSVG